MAERTSTRAGSRRTTPQPAPPIARVGTQSPPNRVTRSTRSQSRDISDSEVRRTDLKARRGAKQVSPDSTNGAVGQSGSESRKGRPANHARIQQGRGTHKTDENSCFAFLSYFSTQERDAQFAKAGRLRGQELSELCIDQRLTPPRSFNGSRRPQYCLS